jgi:signal transduction histidine kinase/CheY-like chemotaxis protein
MGREGASVAEGGSPDLSAWRDQFSMRLARAFLAIFGITGVTVFATLSENRGRAVLVGSAVLGALLCAAPVLTGWPSGRRRAWIILVPSIVSALAGFATVGFIAGPAVVLSLMLLVSGLLLGLRSMLWLSAVAGLALVLVAAGMIHGVLPPPNPVDVSLRSAVPWMRTIAVVFLATSLFGKIVIELVNRLEQSLQQAHSETRRREAAEHARAEAEIAALEAKQLETIGRLAAGVAHDFNNHLTAILGCAELLAETLPDRFENADLVDEINKSAQRATELTRQLLAYSRKAQMVLEPVDLHALIEGAVSLLRRSIDPGVAIVTKLQAESAVIAADATLMQSAFLNLLVNARDAMPEGGELTVATGTHVVTEGAAMLGANLPPGPYLLVEILDTGIGIESDALPKVFDPFFTTKPVGKGTGLGLAAVAGTVKAHQGAIQVESEPGAGTAFRILLPRIEAKVEGPQRQTSVLVHGTGRVLVVDDEPAVRTTAVSTLRFLGYDVTSAADGAAALELVRAAPHRFELVLLDLRMPHLSGEATFDQLRVISRGIRVLIWSGYGAEQDFNAMLRRGAVGFVQKPYRVAELSRTIADAIAAGRSASPRG